MKNQNQRLFVTLGCGWLGFLVTGLIIQSLTTSAPMIILIDRSYCPQNEWQKLVKNYQDLYGRHQEKSLQIEKVVLFSDLGEEVLTIPPTPEQIKELSRYGKSNSQRWEQIKISYPQGNLLVCQ